MVEVGNNFFSTFPNLDKNFLRGKIFICCSLGLRFISIESFNTIDDNVFSEMGKQILVMNPALWLSVIYSKLCVWF